MHIQQTFTLKNNYNYFFEKAKSIINKTLHKKCLVEKGTMSSKRYKLERHNNNIKLPNTPEQKEIGALKLQPRPKNHTSRTLHPATTLNTETKKTNCSKRTQINSNNLKRIL